MLHDFVELHREEILARARLRVAGRSAPVATEKELAQGLPIFFDQLCAALRRGSNKEEVNRDEIRESAAQHGKDLFDRGLTVAQVVLDYGDLCQVVTSLAVEQSAAIDPVDFRTLNMCLDDAIAGAVTEHGRQREV